MWYARFTHISVDSVVGTVTCHVVVGAAIAYVGFDVALVEALGQPIVDFGRVAKQMCQWNPLLSGIENTYRQRNF